MQPEWAEVLGDAGSAEAAFLGLLRHSGVFDSMFADFVKLPHDLAGVRVQTTEITAVSGSEGAARRLFAMDFRSPMGEGFHHQAIVAISKQVLSLAPDRAVSLTEGEVRRAAIAGVDAQFVTLLAAGATSITSSGATAAAVRDDLTAATDAMDLGSDSKLYLVLPPATCRHLAFKTSTTGAAAFPDVGVRGGSVAGITTIPSDAMVIAGSPPSCAPLLVDASRVAAWAGPVQLDRAEHAALEMSDSPVAHVGDVGSPDAPTAPAGMVSLWQVGAVGIRAQRWWAARKATAGCVCVIAGCAW